jgi:hypothetical protein
MNEVLFKPNRYDVLSKFGFSEGSLLTSSELPLLEAVCDEVVQRLPMVDGRWNAEKCFCNFHYVMFFDATTKKSICFYDLEEEHRRRIVCALDDANLLL